MRTRASQAHAPMQFLGIDLAWADNPGSLANETGLVLLAGDGTVVGAGWSRGIQETLGCLDRGSRAPAFDRELSGPGGTTWQWEWQCQSGHDHRPGHQGSKAVGPGSLTLAQDAGVP